MITNTNKKRQEQLGIHYGTACSRLRKILLFEAIKALNKHRCFKCDEIIDEIDQFTIEHKIPWLDNDPDLFWDLDNIAFSHAKCNVPHRQNGGMFSKRKNKEGSWLCLECEAYLPGDAFSLYKSGTPRNWCKSCRSKRKIEGKAI